MNHDHETMINRHVSRDAKETDSFVESRDRRGSQEGTPRNGKIEFRIRQQRVLRFVIALGLLCFASLFTLVIKPYNKYSVKKKLPPWSPGCLHIHHLRVGPSESSFIIFPDGTTFLIDAGSIDIPKVLKAWKEEGYDDLMLKKPYPNGSKSTAGWVLDYLKEFWPRSEADFFTQGLDYLLLTHFHTDHIGDPGPTSPYSKSGNFLLSGVTEIGDQIPIQTILDRGYPEYDAPSGLIHDWQSLENYLKFTEEYSKKGMNVERFEVGSKSQIRMKHDSDSIKDHFLVHNIKGNLDVALNDKVEHINGVRIENEKTWDENELSNAIVIEYGDFRYYEGGDQESHFHQGLGLFDTVSPTAKAAGLVHVATLNHHGHGVNSNFVHFMNPEIIILQGWCSDQPPKKSMEILSTNQKGDNLLIFATDMFEERLHDLGELTKLFASTAGHVVVTVEPPTQGKRQEYEVFVLDGDRKVKSSHGPFST